MIFEKIRLNDLRRESIFDNWLWEFVPFTDGDLWLKPVNVKKTEKLKNRLVGCNIRFANGSESMALVGGLDLKTPVFSKHNKELYYWIDNLGWFKLALYFDSDQVQKNVGIKFFAHCWERILMKCFQYL